MAALSTVMRGRLGWKFSWKAVVLVYTVRRGSGVDGVTLADSNRAQENRFG